MNTKEILSELKALSSEKLFHQNKKRGAGDNQFGVKLGDLRKVAKKIKGNNTLALKLWKTKNIEARLLAILLIEPKELSIEEITLLVTTINYFQVADWFNAYVLKKHPDNELLREKWMLSNHPMKARSGWDLTSQRVVKAPETLDINSLLDRIALEILHAPLETQWTMNFTLANIGIHHPEYREKALKIGEQLGVYRDFPVSKGCTSPFAPIWINEMVSRQ